MKTAEDQLQILNVALGKLAPKGTWLSEQLERIWFAKTEQEAVEIAKYVNLTIHRMRDGEIEHYLWSGDREPK